MSPATHRLEATPEIRAMLLLIVIQVLLFAIWGTILLANRGRDEERIRFSAARKGWEVVAITDESDPVLPISKYRVVYRDGSTGTSRTIFCNPSLFGVLWFRSGFLLPLLP
jgi:hypothetical protein